MNEIVEDVKETIDRIVQFAETLEITDDSAIIGVDFYPVDRMCRIQLVEGRFKQLYSKWNTNSERGDDYLELWVRVGNTKIFTLEKRCP